MIIPPEAGKIFSLVREELAESLVAVYLHGSAVAGGLRPHSDVDLLVVVDRPLSLSCSRHLVGELMKISGYPGTGNGLRPLELIVFLDDCLAEPAYPACCEFIYGEWLRKDFEAGLVPRPVCDPEFTLILAQAREEARALHGPDARDLFPLIPQAHIRRAIGDSLPALIQGAQGDERNVLLTLARMWRTLVSGDFVSKNVAAGWAAARLPQKAALILTDARQSYLHGGECAWSGRQEDVMHTLKLLRTHVEGKL